MGPKKFSAEKTIDAKNKIVSPGFINMLSWGYNTLLEDGRSLSDLKQGVTLEIFGEGNSPGPVENWKQRFCWIWRCNGKTYKKWCKSKYCFLFRCY